MNAFVFRLWILVLISSVILTSCSSSPKKQEEQNEIVKKQVNEFPNMFILTLEGSAISAKRLIGKKTIFILFQPDCDHCQKEAKQIRENIEAFRDYEIYFVTAAKVEEVKNFSIDYKFEEHKNFHFATTDIQSIINSYGPIQAPSIYIYSEQGKLLTQFNGQTEIENILKVL